MKKIKKPKKKIKMEVKQTWGFLWFESFFFKLSYLFNFFWGGGGGGAWVEEGFFISGEVFFVLKLTKSKQYFFRIC